MKTIETKKTMKTKKINLKEQGITLVALVVTIIILLILAGVTINIALRENGLFKMARTGVNKYEQSAVNEQTELANVVESLKKEFEAIDGDEINSNPKKYYGQYVNYGVDLNGDKDYTNDWRLFYVGGTDKDDSDEVKGRIYIIAADYVPMSHEALRGVVAEEGSSTGMQPATLSVYGALSAYWPSAPSFQTPVQNTEEDQTKISVSTLFMHEGHDLFQNKTYPNSKCVSTLLNTDNWSKFVNKSNYGKVAIGGPTVEMWCKAWNAVVDEADGFRKIYPNGKGSSGYYVGENATQTSTDLYYITKSDTSFSTTEEGTIEKKYNVFFPHTELKVTANGATGNCAGYWLASPSANNTYDVMSVGCAGRVNYYDYYYQGGYGLRPLVCLESGVKLLKNTAKSDDTKTVYDIVK